VANADLPDEELVSLVAKADKEALSKLYEKYARIVYSLALKVLRDKELAEEVTQETFFSLWRKADSYQSSKGKVSSWLLSIVHNRAIDEVRRRTRSKEVQADHRPGYVIPALDHEELLQHVAKEEDANSVRKALQNLPPDQLHVLLQSYFNGLTQAEIADRLGIPLGTVKTRMRLGLQKLKAALLDQKKESPSS
jgi:RNA polymerase sigma-70 factor (ECF subfamily)